MRLGFIPDRWAKWRGAIHGDGKIRKYALTVTQTIPAGCSSVSPPAWSQRSKPCDLIRPHGLAFTRTWQRDWDWSPPWSMTVS
jgi:hypothetical protein